METRDIVVIGASAGGIDAISKLVTNLPTDLPASIFVVWHIHPLIENSLPRVLNSKGRLTATLARDREPIERGHIYVAPADCHLLLERGQTHLVRGPKENRARPAIDPLFRSAAAAYGSRVVGVILSGMLDDGAVGLWAIKEKGGVAIVQRPEEAMYESMPINALRNVPVDHVLTVSEIADTIARLARESATEARSFPTSPVVEALNKMTQQEAPTTDVLKLGKPSTFACPECHGVMVSVDHGNLADFRCHTGHAYSATALLASLGEAIETSLWNTLRALQEQKMLLEQLAKDLDPSEANRLAEMIHTSESKATTIKRLVALSTG